ncbi:MAG: histidine kinase [Oscillospiraceae bacterium]|nr:histidine kinase [Oscillospiraceae bacterium]
MSINNIINSSIISFCIIINVIILFFVLTSEVKKEKLSKTFTWVVSVNILMLVSYLFTAIFGGHPNPSYNLLLTYLSTVYQVSTQLLLLLHVKITLLSIEKKADVSKVTYYLAYIAAAAVGINLILSAISPLTKLYFYYDESNIVVFQSIFMLSNVSTFIWTVLTSFILISNRKPLSTKEFCALMSYVILPTAGLLLFIMSAGTIQFIIFSITICVVIYFAGIQSDLARQLEQKELELTQSRIAIMTSQIQPHFIHNALAAIKSMIRVDPDQAAEAIVEFSSYLRSNINSLSNTEPVSFNNELSHVETYLSIEQKRFRNKLNVTYDITERDFCLPALSIQPIVENSVRHGITSRKETGGNISISAHKINDEIVITVADDGAGFDINQIKKEQGLANVGIQNAKTRLAEMVGGTLEIQSIIGTGTTVTIRIPK